MLSMFHDVFNHRVVEYSLNLPNIEGIHYLKANKALTSFWKHVEYTVLCVELKFFRYLLYILDNNYFLSQWKILNTTRNRNIHCSLYIPVYPRQICQDPTSRAHYFVHPVGWEMNLAPISARRLLAWKSLLPSFQVPNVIPLSPHVIPPSPLIIPPTRSLSIFF